MLGMDSATFPFWRFDPISVDVLFLPVWDPPKTTRIEFFVSKRNFVSIIIINLNFSLILSIYLTGSIPKHSESERKDFLEVQMGAARP